jgi:diguanylate cyclase (GGDEF)-like protein
LHNRRGFVAIGEQILEVADRERSAVGVLFLDIDNMKALNDRFGHLAGDRALIVVADALRDALRDADTVARIGGDEFVALAIGLGQDDRGVVERRIRAGLTQPGVEIAPDVWVEVSIGWAMRIPGDQVTVEDLLAAADEAMYGDKARSRGVLPGSA